MPYSFLTDILGSGGVYDKAVIKKKKSALRPLWLELCGRRVREDQVAEQGKKNLGLQKTFQ